MLTITEITIKILDAKKDRVIGRIKEHFYKDILDNALSYQRTEGEISVGFEGREETALGIIVLEELVQNDFDFKRYVDHIDTSFAEDYEIVITYNLENEYKSLDSDTKVG